MTLGYGWAVWTVLTLITGFAAAWRKLEVPRINPLPVMTPYGPVMPAPEPERKSMGPTVATYGKTWAVWVLSGQLIYLLSKVVFAVARNGGDIAAPLVAATGYLWVVPVAAVGVGVAWLLLRAWLRHRPVEVVEEQPLAHDSMPRGPVQPAVEQQTQMWTAPTYEGNWDRQP